MTKMDDILALDAAEAPQGIGVVVEFDIDGGTIAHVGAYALWRLDTDAPATPARVQQLRYIGAPFVVSDDPDALRRLVLEVFRS
jgi:hypothetical protein